MTTTSDALAVMGMVAACHPRTAPRLDDEEAALAIASAWAKLFSTHSLSVDDLKAAVVRRSAEGADSAPEPAEIINVARAIRRDRTERWTRAELEAREAAQDWRVLGIDPTRALPPMPEPEPEPKFVRPSQRSDGTRNPLSVRCPWCRAAKFNPCQIPNMHGENRVILRAVHPSRIEAAEVRA